MLELLSCGRTALLLEESCLKREPPGSKVSWEGGQSSSLGQLASLLVPDCSLDSVEGLRINSTVWNPDVWQKYRERLPNFIASLPC